MQTQISDPRLEPLTSITRVNVSDDFSIARINVSVLSDSPARRALSVRALQSAAGRLRTLVADALSLRVAPRLEFHLDESLRRSAATVSIIDQVMQRDAALRHDAAEPRGADDAEAGDQADSATPDARVRTGAPPSDSGADIAPVASRPAPDEGRADHP